MYDSITDFPQEIQDAIPQNAHNDYVEIFHAAWAQLTHVADKEERLALAQSAAWDALYTGGVIRNSAVRTRH